MVIEAGTQAHARALSAHVAARGLDRVRSFAPPSTVARGLDNVLLHFSRA